MITKAAYLTNLSAIQVKSYDGRQLVDVPVLNNAVLKGAGCACNTYKTTALHISRELNIKYKDTRGHNLPYDLLTNLPELLSQPVAIVPNTKQDNSLMVVLNTVDKQDNPVVCIIESNATIKGTNDKCNFIRTIYGAAGALNAVRYSVMANTQLYLSASQMTSLMNKLEGRLAA